LFFCEQAGYRNLLTFDMGGTSTDVALIQDAKTNIRRETIVGDVRVRAPSVDVRTIGAGGGSIAFVAELTKALRVGPESAGAVPGPAAYMKGGELPTVCDANVVLGYLPSDAQLGGAMAINRDAAVAAVQKVADALGIDVMEAAEGIIRIANEAMFGALRLVSVEQGYDPRDFSLVGFGGAGPLHANALGRLVNSFPVIVPPGPGVLCAYGDATTQLQDEAARSYGMLAGDVSPDQLKQDLLALRDRAAQALLADGIPEDQLDVTYQADVRYAGQAFQISVNFDIAGLDANGLAVITDVFDDEHEKLFTFKLGDGHEIVMIRAVVASRGQALEVKLSRTSDATLADCAIHETRIYFEGSWYDATIYERYKLHTELVVPGPAIVTEMDSTTLILPGYQARTDVVGNLLIEPSASEQGA
jgi:N-methylhydantoinase A